MRRRPRCNAPATDRWSRRRTGRSNHTHLCSRPLKGLNRSPLGRETAIQKCVCAPDGWLYLAQGGQVPAVKVPAPSAAVAEPRPRKVSYAFSPEGLPLDFQWLRTPASSGADLFALGPAGLASAHWRASRSAHGSNKRWSPAGRSTSPIAARRRSIFAPLSFQQSAGLVAYYNRYKFHFLAVGWDETAGRSLTIMSCEGDYPEGGLTFPLFEPIPLDGEGPVRLAVHVDRAELRFSYAVDDGWRAVGPRSSTPH